MQRCAHPGVLVGQTNLGGFVENLDLPSEPVNGAFPETINPQSTLKPGPVCLPDPWEGPSCPVW